MKSFVFKGYVYEALEEPTPVEKIAGNEVPEDDSLDQKTLNYIYDKMANALKNLNDVEHTVTDGNQKKAIASLMKKTRETFNDKIKGVDYHPQSIDDMKKTADTVDAKMKEQQLADNAASSDGVSSADSNTNSNINYNEKYA